MRFRPPSSVRDDLSEAVASAAQTARDNCFAFSPDQLDQLFNPKSIPALYALGGLHGLEYGLRTDLSAGLLASERNLPGAVTLEEARQAALCKTESNRLLLANSTRSRPDQETSTPFFDRTRVFGRNVLPEAKRKGFGRLLWDAYNDKIIILLTIAAVVSLALGIYEAVSGQSQVDWIEGVAVCVAILIVVAATAGNDWQKERQFARLNRLKVDRQVRVIRSGRPMMLHINDLVVGEVVDIGPGDCAPADGVVITNHGLKCDESMATGESDQIEKVSAGTATDGQDPFIISGSKVLEGMGTYLVTSVGPHSTYGRIMVSLGTESAPTPLQVKLGKLANWIGWFGLGAALLLFFVLLFRFLARLPDNDAPSTVKGQEFMDILIVTVTVIVVAIPEGLPLAVTLALAFATARMLKENNLVRQLRACETMGNATVICSDKTGTLTQNRMTVVAGFLSTSESFGQLPLENASRPQHDAISGVTQRYPGALKALLVKSLVVNSTAFEEQRENERVLVGNNTEIALLRFAQTALDVRDVSTERERTKVEQVYPFDSARKAMAVVYRLGTGHRLLVKGAAEVVLGACTESAIPGLSDETSLARAQISREDRRTIHDQINTFARASLRTIAIAYRELPGWNFGQAGDNEKGSLDFDALFNNLTWIGAFGIHDPLRPEVPEAIRKCHAAGVQVKMVTGDNIHTALSIAISCGIKTDDGIAMEGPDLRMLTEGQLNTTIPRLQVLARSSPSDKQLLVEHLKRLGATVAVTGDGTNDGPALKAADVGFSMGLSGTEVAREASSIILLDDNFRSIVTAIAWGRCVNDAVAKFLQFQITVNITAVCLTVVTAIYSSSNESVFKAVQLLWLNLIMDTFAALALATDPPTEDILQRPPRPRSAPLFTVTMWKLMLGQSIYKLALCFTLYFAGNRILKYNTEIHRQQVELDTVIFNTFVWMQIFNELNCRRLDNKFNIFEGILRNRWFMVINALMVGGQVLIIFVGGAAFGVTRLDGPQWAICIGCAAFCIPWAAVLKLVPDRHVARLMSLVSIGVGVVLAPLRQMCRALVRTFNGFFRRAYVRDDEEWNVSQRVTRV
ncbi:calcium-transporting ATPase 2 [Aspergillus lentulus]|uniref:Calcium-transporting ATPase n=1 Tax=Aspergillus lentulus TaxID=293939 RepID=A0AAN4PF13_ASPLE|nr:calcium-transporting ATPase 2 [Aspergillus lentulus]